VRTEGILGNYLRETDEQFVISKAVAPVPERYDPSTSTPLKNQEAADHTRWLTTWKRIDLGHVFGFPAWEKEVFLLLQGAFPELRSIFSQYAKSGSAGSGSAKSAETMQQTELTDLALDCGIASEAFPMARVQNIFERADQVGDGAAAKGGDNALELHEFLEAVVMLAFHRFNPKFGTVGHNTADAVAQPLPGCLETLLKKHLLTKAKTDTLAKVKKMIEKDPEVQLALRPRKAALKVQFEKAAKADSTMTAGSTLMMSMEKFCDDLFERKVTKDIMVDPTPVVKGVALPKRHSNLSWLDAKGAFVTCQSGGAAAEDGSQTMTFDEFVICLGLCGHIKYEEVEEMSLPARVEGIIANYIGEKDEHAVITSAVAPPMERFTPPPVSSGVDKKWLETWSKMDLSHVFGFPTWEKEVYVLLEGSLKELRSIFHQYSKMGSAGSSSAHAAETMQQSELINLALDCGIASEAFPMARVINIFERADQVDDTLSQSKADMRVVKGQNAKGGDGNLELHEFLELCVMLAFARANPKFGEIGHTDAAAVASPLPGCLDALLKKSLLQNAKRDAVAGVKAQINENPDVQVALWSYKAALLKQWKSILGAQSGVLSMDAFLDDLFDRGIIRDQMVAPTSAVVGAALPEVHLNLSLLDAKGAFVTAQKADETQRFDGSAKSTIDYDEWIVALALCGHIKFEEVGPMSLAQRVSGLMANYLCEKDEVVVLTEVLVPKVERFTGFSQASPLAGQTLAAHSLFIETWKALDLSRVVGFPAWEKEVFELLQPCFEQVSAVFFSYAKAVGAGSSSSSSTLDETMQENELASLVRDTGLATDTFPLARVNTLYAQVSGEKRNDQLTLPGFVTLLVLIALHRANPKLGSAGAEGSTVAAPLPGCLDSLLKKHVLKGAKKEKQAAMKAELKTSLDLPKLFRVSRNALKKEFEASCKAREKSRSLFGQLVMSSSTLVTEMGERKLIGALKMEGGGEGGADVELQLSAADVERAFVSCQRGDGGDEGNKTIDFEEFLLCLSLCGMSKYEDMASMSTESKVASIVANYLGEKDENAAIGAAMVPTAARFDASQVMGLPGHSAAEHERWMAAWMQVDLSMVPGFPLWEREVFEVLHNSFTDLLGLFTYYAYANDASGPTGASAETMQQTELVDLALDCGLATKEFPMTRIVSLFDETNQARGSTDTDLELHEFFTLLTALAFARANPGYNQKAKNGPPPKVSVPDALDELVHKQLSRTSHLERVTPKLAALKADLATTAVLRVHEAALRSFFNEAVPSGPLMSERAFLTQLSAAGLMRGVIVKLPPPTGGEARCDLTWLDASSAYHACVTSEAGMLVGDYATCLALCGMLKYQHCTPMTIVQQVAGFLANLAGRMDEHEVLKTSLSSAAAHSPRASRPRRGSASESTPSASRSAECSSTSTARR